MTLVGIGPAQQQKQILEKTLVFCRLDCHEAGLTLPQQSFVQFWITEYGEVDLRVQETGSGESNRLLQAEATMKKGAAEAAPFRNSLIK